MTQMHSTDVPPALRRWFVVHCIADLLFAVPLIFAPKAFAALVHYGPIDPLTARLVGAALVGIGVESYLGKDATRASFVTMLRLKVLWSVTANIGIAWSIAEGAAPIAWLFQVVFLAFSALWIRYFILLRN